jgi:hypothetical protein
MDNTHLSLRFESVALFVFSLAIGILLLKLRDLLFGRGIDGRNHHISFKKKIEEEEKLNLDVLMRHRRCKSV